MEKIMPKLLEKLKKNEDTVLAMIINDAGSTPRGSGCAMLVGKEGILEGTVGGGTVEVLSEQLGKDLIDEKRSMEKHFVLAPSKTEDIGMICGGNVDIYFQYIDASEKGWHEIAMAFLESRDKKEAVWLVLSFDGKLGALFSKDGEFLAGSKDIDSSGLLLEGCVKSEKYFSVYLAVGERAIIFGGGHCAQALANILKTVGFRIVIMDNLEEFASRELYPFAERTIVGDFTKLSEYIDLKDDDYYIVMTNGHEFDLQCEEQLLKRPFAYLGVIGSRRKTATINNKLKEEGFSDEAIASIHAPIGLKIKAVTPEEIAVSIASEIILERALRREKQSEESHACPMH